MTIRTFDVIKKNNEKKSRGYPPQSDLIEYEKETFILGRELLRESKEKQKLSTFPVDNPLNN